MKQKSRFNRRKEFKGIIIPDVSPLDQRERKMNTRKGMKPALPEKKPIKAIIQMSLFGNPYAQMTKSVETLLKDNNDFIPDSLKPEYVKKYYGHEIRF